MARTIWAKASSFGEDLDRARSRGDAGHWQGTLQPGGPAPGVACAEGQGDGEDACGGGGGAAGDPLGGTAESWDGSVQFLSPKENATLAKTTNGTMVLALYNRDSKNQAGQVSLNWGGHLETVPLPALANAPVLKIKDFGGDALSVTNTSQADLSIAAWGPGMATSSQDELRANGNPLALPPYNTCWADTTASYQQLTLSAEQDYTVFVLFAGDQVTTLCVNAPGQAQAGYDTWDPDSSLPIARNWMAARLMVINLSPGKGQQGQVSLLSLS